MRNTKKSSFFLFAITVFVTAFNLISSHISAETNVPFQAGHYCIKGTAPTHCGSLPYVGTAEVTVQDASLGMYSIIEHFPAMTGHCDDKYPEETSESVGFQNGNILSIATKLKSDDKQYFGIAVYTVKKNGSSTDLVDGKWTHLGEYRLGTETWTHAKPGTCPSEQKKP